MRTNQKLMTLWRLSKRKLPLLRIDLTKLKLALCSRMSCRWEKVSYLAAIGMPKWLLQSSHHSSLTMEKWTLSICEMMKSLYRKSSLVKFSQSYQVYLHALTRWRVVNRRSIRIRPKRRFSLRRCFSQESRRNGTTRATTVKRIRPITINF